MCKKKAEGQKGGRMGTQPSAMERQAVVPDTMANVSVTLLLSQLAAVTATRTAVTSTAPCTWRAAASVGACAKTASTTPRGNIAIAADPFSTGTPSRPSRIPMRASVSPQPVTRSLPLVWANADGAGLTWAARPRWLSSSSRLRILGSGRLQKHFGPKSFSFSEQVEPDNPGPSW